MAVTAQRGEAGAGVSGAAGLHAGHGLPPGAVPCPSQQGHDLISRMVSA